MNEVDRDTFIEENMGLVGMVVKEFKNRIHRSSYIDMDDLFQIGTIGLIKAYDRFDPEQGIKFSGFAITSIRWEIQMFLRDKLDGVKVGGNTVYTYLNILQSNLINESPGVISAILDIPIKSVENALAYHKCKYVDSLERPLNNDDGDTIFLGETIGYEIDFDKNLEIYKLQELLKGLNKRTQEVLELRLQGLSQYEIGKSLGLSQSYISRLINQAKQKLEKEGVEMSKDKTRDFKLAKRLAIETDLSASEISKQTGISYTTAYNYINNYRVTKEKIEAIEQKIKKEESPVKTYKLSPEELEKYREGGPVSKVINDRTKLVEKEPIAKKESKVEITTEIKTPDYNLAKRLAEQTDLNANEISDKSGISYTTAQSYIEYYRKTSVNEEEKPIREVEKSSMLSHRLDIPEEIAMKPEINPADGFMTMTFKLTTENATSQLEEIVKAMGMLGFKDLSLTIQSQQIA